MERDLAISLLTGGGDPHYAFGLSMALVSQGTEIDLVGSDEFEQPAFRNKEGIRVLNLRGGVDPNAGARAKITRILRYYARLIAYAASSRTKLFHILWNNKFEVLDRTALMLYYKLLGKKVVLTAHNVNAGKRDGADSRLNRITLRTQYRLADHLFVHTEKMAQELVDEFGVFRSHITVIPYGINNAVPDTSLTSRQARERLGLGEEEKVLLFFGRITPYKGLEYLLAAFRKLRAQDPSYRLLIAGRPDGSHEYWQNIRNEIVVSAETDAILLKDEFIPDDQTEVYFKAADALVLAYRHIYQSGILYLGHSFGLPVLASDVGAFREEIVEGQTGYTFPAGDVDGLTKTIQKYFGSALYRNLANRRGEIKDYVRALHSWDAVGRMTKAIYSQLLSGHGAEQASNPKLSSASCSQKSPF